jgi:hypothetical protein
VLCKAKVGRSLKVFEIWDCGEQFRLPNISPRKEVKAHSKTPMAKIFGILTAITLALSAFIAFKNKAAYEADVSAKDAEHELLTKSEARLKAGETLLTALPDQRAAVDADVETSIAAESAERKAEVEIKTQIDAITAKIAANKEKLDAVRVKTAKIGDLKELSSKMRATNGELEELTQSITVAESKLANLTAEDSSLKAKVEGAKGQVESFGNAQSTHSMKTRIRSIYPNWGFVTLASGNNAGVVANSTLDVVRDGETIAKLLVTAVENNSSSASIVPDSLASDATLRVGDQVISGQKTAKPISN